jgi:SAM-dependent methyltransferase
MPANHIPKIEDSMETSCPACGANNTYVFYTQENIPVHSVRLLWSKNEALHFPTGDLSLGFCPDCGFIFNQKYNPALQDYSAEYESTQAYSGTFNSFARRLAQQLIDRFDLHQKDIIEIGCGQGEFLSLLSELGQNRGVGFDPAYDPARSALTSTGRVTVIPDYYSEKYSGYKADFIVCKMTLEHIRDVADFIAVVRRSIGSRSDMTVFFQVPNVTRVLEEVAFWDIYYEHCSYFSMGSLARLFRREGFEVIDLWRDYGDQYLMIEARPANGSTQPKLPQEDDLESLKKQVASFQDRYPHVLDQWKRTITDAARQQRKIVLWGSGSKGVAFLTRLSECDDIQYTVDINPNKKDTYMASTGQKVVTPDFLTEYRPDLVILMNPLYQGEVQAILQQKGLHPQIVSVGA